MTATILDVVRDGRCIALGVGIKDGLLTIVAAGEQGEWPGRLARDERRKAVARLAEAGRHEEGRAG